MKKQIFGLMALILCACAGLTACSDDDDDDSTNAALVGKWQSVASKNWEEDVETHPFNQKEWEAMPLEDDDESVTEFKSDGTCIMTEYYHGEVESSHTANYTVENNKLTMSAMGQSISYNILELTSDKLTVEGGDQYFEVRGKRYFYKEYGTFRRIK